MARYRAAGDADLDQLPWAYRKGHGIAIGWQSEARCRRMKQTVHSDKYGGDPTIWHVEADKTYVTKAGENVAGADLIEVATSHCTLCSVQWDCARQAVELEERHGVWGMTIEELEFLRLRVSNPVELIELARMAGTPVQVSVRAVMAPIMVGSPDGNCATGQAPVQRLDLVP